MRGPKESREAGGRLTADMARDFEGEATRTSRFSADLAAVAALVAVTLAFFARVIVRREVFFHGDIGSLFAPGKYFYAERLKHWDLPFWNPYIFCGYPQQAEGQVGSLYPLHVLAFWILRPETALTVLLVLHLFLCGLFMYVFARTLRLGAPAAFLTGFFYMFSGFALSHFHHPTILFPAAWAPLLLAALELALRRGSWLIGAWGGVVLGMQALLGYPPMVLYSSIAALIYVLARGRQAARELGFRKVVAVAAATLGFGAALSAVQMVPTLQLTSYTMRAFTSPLEYMTAGSLAAKHVPLFVFPNYLGQAAFATNAEEPFIWEFVGYVGLLPLSLALVAWASWRRSWPFAVMAMIGVFMAAAQVNPLYLLLQFVPGLQWMRVPARYLILTVLALCTMAGLALDSLLQGCRRGRGGSWALLPCLACAAFTLLVVVPARRTGATPHIWGVEISWAAGTFAVSALLIGLARLRKIGAAPLVTGCAIVAAADLWSFGYFLAPSISPDFFRDPPRVVEFLKRDRTWYRIISWETQKFLIPTLQAKAVEGLWGNRGPIYLEREALMPNWAETFGVREVRGDAAFQVTSHEILTGMAMSTLARSGHDPTLMGLLGAKYIVTAEDLDNPHLHLVYDSGVKVYRNDLAMPRCFFVTSAVVAPDLRSQVALMMSPAYQPARVAVLGREPAVEIPANAEPAKAAIEWTEPSPERLVVRVNCDRPGLLIVSDTYDAAWKVFVDGQEDEILVADYSLRGVALRPGRHVVEFRYDPLFFATGARISAFAGVVLVGFTCAALYRRRRKPETEDSA